MTITRIAPLRTALPILTGLLLSGSILTSGAGAAPAHRPAQGSIKSVILTTSDVNHIYGGTFKAFMSGVISNQELASSEKSVKSTPGFSAMQAGRVTGYDSVWVRGMKTTALLEVINSVSEYQNSSFLQAQFSHAFMMPKVKGMTLTPFRGVGDQAFLLTERQHGITNFGIMFRRGRYVANVTAGAEHGTGSRSNVSKLAAIEDQRIQANG
jgi:hypothetical protein